MKNNSSKLVKAAIQSALYFTTIYSLLLDTEPSLTGMILHSVVGGFLLITSTVHFLSFKRLHKSVGINSTKTLSFKARTSRIINLGMCIVGPIVAISGILRLIDPVERLVRIHSLCGSLLIVLIGIHMLMHWGWLIAHLRQFFSPRQNRVDVLSSERLPIVKKQPGD